MNNDNSKIGFSANSLIKTYKNALNKQNIPIFEINNSLDILYVNEALIRLFNISNPVIGDLSLENLFNLEILKKIKGLFNSNNNLSDEMKFKIDDKEIGNFNLLIYPVLDENPENILYLCVIDHYNDIKPDLDFSDNKPDSGIISENLSIPIAVIINEKIVWVNKSFTKIFGYNKADVINCSLDKIILSSEYRDYLDFLNFKTNEFHCGCSYETIGIDSKGKVLNLSVYAKKIHFYGENAFQLLFEDITERKNAFNLTKIQRDLALKLASSVNLEEALEYCLKNALSFGEIDSGGFYLIDNKSIELKMMFYNGFEEDFVSDFTINLWKKFLNNTNNLDNPLYFTNNDIKKNYKSDIENSNVKSLGILPLMHEHEFIGCLAVASHKYEKIPSSTAIILEAIIAQLGCAMSRLITLKALKENEELFRTLYHSISDLIIILNPDFSMRFVSGSVEKVTGYNQIEIMINGFISIIIKEEEIDFKEIIELAIKNVNTEYIHRVKIKCKNNEERILECVIYNLQEKPYIKGIIVNARDVTLRIHAEKALRESEERYRLLVENAIDAIVILDNDNFIYYNPAFSNIFGYKKSILIGQSINSILPETPLGISHYSNILSKLKNKSIKKSQFELEILSDSGKLINVMASGYMVNLEDKSVFILMMKDITEKKKDEAEREKLILELENANREMEIAYEKVQAAYEKMEVVQIELTKTNEELSRAFIKAEEANKQKSEFLAIMSHELRTPLTGILGFSELLSTDKVLNNNQKEFSLRINKLGKKLLHIINDLLELSVIEAGKVKISYSEFDVNEIINDVYYIYEEELNKKELVFNKEVPENNIIFSDPQRIRQILLNIIGNSVKFTTQGSINLKILQREKDYLFSVSDTGIGIAKGKSKYIFDMFTQIDGANSRKYSGSGLGLAICNKLLTMLNGEIWVESELNQGSIFYFTIPIIEKKAALYKTEGIRNPLLIKKKINILFAEDDINSYRLIEEILSISKMCNFKGFNDGLPLVEEYKKNQNYDLIILDIQMSNMSGVDALIEIRKINPHLPVIAVSAFATEKDKNKYSDFGFTDFISKPISIDLFMQTINNNI